MHTYIYIYDIHIIYFGIVIGLIFFWWIPLTHQAAPFLLGKCGIDWKPWNWRKMDRSWWEGRKTFTSSKGGTCFQHFASNMWGFPGLVCCDFFCFGASFEDVLLRKFLFIHNSNPSLTLNLLVQQNFEPETTNIHWSLMNFFFGETTAFFFLPLFLYNLDSSSFGKPDLRRLHQPDDLVSVSTENAKNLALSAMWCALPSSRNTRCAGGGMVVRWRTHPHTISL